MRSLLQFLTAALGLVATAQAFNQNAVRAFNKGERVRQKHAERLATRAPEPPKVEKRQSKFNTQAAQQFVVNGSAIPDVDFDIGESYAGLLPISQDPNESRQLYFWFFPSTNPDAGEEIAIWFNGGPGCSSLSGLLTENGREYHSVFGGE
jgi:carboxypeptidase D